LDPILDFDEIRGIRETAHARDFSAFEHPVPGSQRQLPVDTWR
jgi:hypothetical protein